MIELVDGFWVSPENVTVIKRIDNDRCAIWVTGQSATEAFILDYPAEEVVEALDDALEKELYDDDGDDEEEDEDEA